MFDVKVLYQPMLWFSLLSAVCLADTQYNLLQLSFYTHFLPIEVSMNLQNQNYNGSQMTCCGDVIIMSAGFIWKRQPNDRLAYVFITPADRCSKPKCDNSM